MKKKELKKLNKAYWTDHTKVRKIIGASYSSLVIP